VIIQLAQILPLDTPKGKAWAHFLIDYGTEHNLQWVCFMVDTGECWTWDNRDIKLEMNLTMHIRSQYAKVS